MVAMTIYCPLHNSNIKSYKIAAHDYDSYVVWSNLLQHPDFVDMGSQGYPNDIAVITFSQPLVILPTTTNLRTIQLADDSTSLSNVAIMGWGRTSGNAITAAAASIRM